MNYGNFWWERRCISVSFSLLISSSPAPTYEGQSWKYKSAAAEPTGLHLPVRARASRFICQWPGPVWYSLSHRWIYHHRPELRGPPTQYRGLHFLQRLNAATSANSPQPGQTPPVIFYVRPCSRLKVEHCRKRQQMCVYGAVYTLGPTPPNPPLRAPCQINEPFIRHWTGSKPVHTRKSVGSWKLLIQSWSLTPVTFKSFM